MKCTRKWESDPRLDTIDETDEYIEYKNSDYPTRKFKKKSIRARMDLFL